MIVAFENVDFAYEGTPVLEGVSFRIQEGAFTSIVGPNGGGKTTLLRLMLGLLTPTRGSVKLMGKEPCQCRRQVGYMPQFLQVDPGFPVTAMDVVLMGQLRPYCFHYSRKDRREAEESLHAVRMFEYRDRPFSRLSGGQRQRILIARALGGHPKLLLLDEPTNNIDPSSEEMLFDILTELNKRLTIVIVSHDIGCVSKHVRSVLCVNRDVVEHPTSRLDGQIINELYGSAGARMIRHDQCCGEH